MMHKSISTILEVTYLKLETARQQDELKPDTDLSVIIGPFIPVMSGFGKMREVKKILGPTADAIDGETAITMLFKGFFHYRKRNCKREVCSHRHASQSHASPLRSSRYLHCPKNPMRNRS